jgi:malate dehydrogenase (oxaloacetate-decarboxylating)(NADP+)
MKVLSNVYFQGLASLYPEPSDKKNWLKQQLYNFNYESSMPITWPWPEMPDITTRPLEPTLLSQANFSKKN